MLEVLDGVVVASEALKGEGSGEIALRRFRRLPDCFVGEGERSWDGDAELPRLCFHDVQVACRCGSEHRDDLDLRDTHHLHRV